MRVHGGLVALGHVVGRRAEPLGIGELDTETEDWFVWILRTGLAGRAGAVVGDSVTGQAVCPLSLQAGGRRGALGEWQGCEMPRGAGRRAVPCASRALASCPGVLPLVPLVGAVVGGQVQQLHADLVVDVISFLTSETRCVTRGSGAGTGGWLLGTLWVHPVLQAQRSIHRGHLRGAELQNRQMDVS